MVKSAEATIWGVVIWVVKVGEVPKTATPVPVSSERESIKYWEVPAEVKSPPVVVKTPRAAVRPEKVMFPEEVKPVKPEATPAVETSQLEVLTEPKSPLSPRVKAALAVNAPLAVKPDVAVIKPEIVGVAVQAVPVTVKFPPSEVKLLPETVKVLSKVVAP